MLNGRSFMLLCGHNRDCGALHNPAFCVLRNTLLKVNPTRHAMLHHTLSLLLIEDRAKSSEYE